MTDTINETNGTAQGRRAAAGSTAHLNEAINEARVKAMRCQAVFGADDERTGWALGLLEGLQKAKAIIQGMR